MTKKNDKKLPLRGHRGIGVTNKRGEHFLDAYDENRPLTEPEKKFCRLFACEGWTQRAAAIESGYPATSSGTDQIKKPRVIRYLKLLWEERKTRDDFFAKNIKALKKGPDREWVLATLTDIASDSDNKADTRIAALRLIGQIEGLLDDAGGYTQITPLVISSNGKKLMELNAKKSNAN